LYAGKAFVSTTYNTGSCEQVIIEPIAEVLLDGVVSYGTHGPLHVIHIPFNSKVFSLYLSNVSSSIIYLIPKADAFLDNLRAAELAFHPTWTNSFAFW